MGSVHSLGEGCQGCCKDDAGRGHYCCCIVEGYYCCQGCCEADLAAAAVSSAVSSAEARAAASTADGGAGASSSAASAAASAGCDCWRIITWRADRAHARHIIRQ